MAAVKKMPLKGAEDGKVRTRFPPEASGFLHIGHAKAALTNFILAKDFNGTMIFRFDDTNPEKENTDYEAAIIQDLASLGITWDGEISYTSNFFPQLLELAEKMIKDGWAYCDDTPMLEMRELRGKGEPTANRDNSVERNLELWENMKAGDEQGKKTCLRAKLSVNNANKCLRDPVLYRCKDKPHPHHGDKYKLYPTYDFACPVVDALEGVTHALRTSEYNDRNPQYEWIAKKAGLTPPKIQDFSRLNMEYTVMSKRKLTEFVQRGVVTGWDDPRMPTVRGLIRRGVLVDALKDFVREQGLSRTVNTMEWEKIYNHNKRYLDAKAPRYTCVDEYRIPVTLSGIDGTEETEAALHPKDASIGKKTLYKSNKIFLEEKDVELLKDGEEVTLLNWGNAIIEKINKDDSGKIVDVQAKLHLEGDFKKTEQKLTWLADHPNNVLITMHEFDNIINVRSVDKDTELTDEHMNTQTEYILDGVADPGIANLKKGDIIQFQRRGFYILDSRPEEGTNGLFHFFFIPDGRLKLNHLSAMKRAGKKEVTLEDRKTAANERGAKAAANNAKPKAEKKPRGKAAAPAAEGAAPAAEGAATASAAPADAPAQ